MAVSASRTMSRTGDRGGVIAEFIHEDTAEDVDDDVVVALFRLHGGVGPSVGSRVSRASMAAAMIAWFSAVVFSSPRPNAPVVADFQDRFAGSGGSSSSRSSAQVANDLHELREGEVAGHGEEPVEAGGGHGLVALLGPGQHLDLGHRQLPARQRRRHLGVLAAVPGQAQQARAASPAGRSRWCFSQATGVTAPSSAQAL